jgi:hypothetical protein
VDIPHRLRKTFFGRTMGRTRLRKRVRVLLSNFRNNLAHLALRRIHDERSKQCKDDPET